MGPTGKSSGGTGLNAIERLLEAERQAENAIADCQEMADARIQVARQQARHIAQRAHNRTTAIHNHCAEVVRQRIADMWSDAGTVEDDTFDVQAHPDHLKTAVDRLAAKLTGDGDD